MKRQRAWLLPVACLSAVVAGSGLMTGVGLRAFGNRATPPSQDAGQGTAPGLDEAAVRKLFEDYYAAYEARNVDRTVSFWHTQSRDYLAVQKRLAAFFPLQQYKFSNLLVTRLQSGLEESTARVVVDVAVVTGRPGNKPDHQRWVRNVVLRPDAGVWRIVRESDPIEALVRRLRRATSQDERIGLLAEDPDLVTPSLAREIEREVMVMGVRPDQALDWYRVMEQVARRAESPQFIGAAMMGRARVYEALEEPDVAMELRGQALAVFDAANLPDLVGDAEAMIGTARLKRLDYPAARDHFRAAAAAFHRSGDQAAEAAAFYSLGTCHFFEGEWDLALAQYRESLRLQEGLLAAEDANAGNLRRRAVASAYQAIGMVEQERGDYDAAVRSLSESLRRYTDLGEPGGTIATRLDLARLRRRQNLPDKSLQEYLAAAEVADRAEGAYRDLPQIAGIDREIAELLTHERQYTAAWDYYQRCKDLSDQAKDPKGLSAALVGMGTLHYVQGRHGEALELYMKALAIREALDDRPAIAWTLVNVGLAQSAQKKHGEAIRSYSRSVEIAQGLKNSALDAILLTLVARAHLGLGDTDEAQTFARKAESLASESRDRDVLERAHLIAGAAYRSAGRLDDAAKEIELAMQDLEQLRVDRDSGRSDEFFSDDEGPYVAKIELALEQRKR